MRVELSINKSTNNTLNKDLEVIHIININFRGDIDVSTPYITISKIPYEDLLKINYVNIPDFKRGYFIKNISHVTGKIFRIDLIVDVLSSFKKIVLGSYGNVNRALKDGDYYRGDLDLSYNVNIEKYDSNVNLESGRAMFMSTLGVK